MILTSASPTDMTWLHSADAKRLGIAASAISESDNDTLMIADAPVPRSLRGQAIEFVGQWFNAWNTLSDNEIMPWLATRYADTIVFNGAIAIMMRASAAAVTEKSPVERAYGAKYSMARSMCALMLSPGDGRV